MAFGGIAMNAVKRLRASLSLCRFHAYPNPPIRSEPVSDAVIGELTWEACETCKHYREDWGGCEPLDRHIVTLSITDTEDVACDQWQLRPRSGQ